MISTQEYNFILTGTNFGPLGNYNRSNYIDGYFFNDLFLNPNIAYNKELSANGFLEFYTDNEVSGIPGLTLWLDTQDTTRLSTSGIAITAIRDKSTNNYIFSCLRDVNVISNLALSAFWPINYFPLSSTFLKPKPCIRITKNSTFFNDSFALNTSSPFSIYFVWKDINQTNYSIPFAFKTIYDSITGEIVAINQYQTNEQIPEEITWGLRETDFGIRVPSVSGKFFEENIINWRYDSTSFNNISSKFLLINNLPYTINDNIILTGNPILSGTSVGYLSGNNNNDFYFGEMLIFDRILTEKENVNLLNYLYNKWNMFQYFTNNSTITGDLSGGELTNTSYEDFSILTSIYSIPLQSCVTRLFIDLKKFDQSASKINKVIFEYNNKQIEVPSTFTDRTTSIEISLQTPIQDFIITPNTDNQISTYFVYLSVYRYDSTINKIVLSGNIVKCSLLEYNSKSKLLDSQIVDNSKDILLVFENNNSFIFTNILNVSAPKQILSGGDIEGLRNKEVIDESENVILLEDLLEDAQTTTSVLRTPGIPPVPSPKINPIRPL